LALALFRDLAPEQKESTTNEINRQQTIVLNLFEAVAGRAIHFVVLILSASVVTLVLAGTHYAYNSVLFMLESYSPLVTSRCLV
jgi:hypothetical protein